MIIKLQNGYLDYDGDVDVVRKIKTFENISESDGDVSFAFDLPTTANNMRLLQPQPDASSKPVYHKIKCDLLDENGLPVYAGFLVVEKLSKVISVSFFSGNSNWFGMLSGPMSDIDFSEFDQEQSLSNIILSHSATEGVVFQVMDNAGLQTRGYRHLLVEDFVASIYVKTVFKKIFQHHSIKIQGELLSDPVYNSVVTVKNGKSQEDLDSAATFATSTSTTARPVENTNYKVTFDDDTTYPNYDGSLNPFDPVTSTYTAPFKMVADLEVILRSDIQDASYNNRIFIYINGVFTFVDIGLASGTGGLWNSATSGTEEFFKLTREITLEAGDTLEVYTAWQQSGGSTQNDVVSGTISVKPKYIYSVFGNAIVPKWTQAQYVSNILKLLNVVPVYDDKTATLTLNLFDKIKQKTAIDLSDYLSDTEVDYREFVSSYGKQSLFAYQKQDFEDLRKYNVQNFFKYGEGVMYVDNDFIDDKATVIELDFSNPIDYINNVFGQSMTKTDLLSITEDQQYDVTSVTDSGGNARFNVAENNILDGSLVRISESTNANYNGDWVVNAKGTGYLEVFGIPFDTDATMKITKLNFDYNDSDTVYLLWNIPFYQVPDISEFDDFRMGAGNRTFAAYAYFSLLNTGNQVNTDFKQSLSFGSINDPLFYQYTILDIYWQVFNRILNDPVKLFSTLYVPASIYRNLDFLSPISITTQESTNLYYVNKITGYRTSYYPADIELIKLP